LQLFSRPPSNNRPVAAQGQSALIFRVARLRLSDDADQLLKLSVRPPLGHFSPLVSHVAISASYQVAAFA
jgi:hypothetical protein